MPSSRWRAERCWWRRSGAGQGRQGQDCAVVGRDFFGALHTTLVCPGHFGGAGADGGAAAAPDWQPSTSRARCPCVLLTLTASTDQPCVLTWRAAPLQGTHVMFLSDAAPPVEKFMAKFRRAAGQGRTAPAGGVGSTAGHAGGDQARAKL